MKGTPIVLVAVALVLVAVPGSAASPVPFLRIPAGPALAGDGVVWTQGVGPTLSVVLWTPGRGRSVISRFESDGFLSLAGSDSVLPEHLAEALAYRAPAELATP